MATAWMWLLGLPEIKSRKVGRVWEKDDPPGSKESLEISATESEYLKVLVVRCLCRD